MIGILDEAKKLELTLNRKKHRAKRCSTFIGLCTIILNILIILCSSVIIIITSIFDSQNVISIVLNSVIVALSSINFYLSIGNKGFYYLYNSMQISHILDDLRDTVLTISNYTDVEVHKLLTLYRRRMENIDLSLYKLATTGIAKFSNGSLEIVENNTEHLPDNIDNIVNDTVNDKHVINKDKEEISEKDSEEDIEKRDKKRRHSDSHIFIHIQQDNRPPISLPILKPKHSQPEKQKAEKRNEHKHLHLRKRKRKVIRSDSNIELPKITYNPTFEPEHKEESVSLSYSL